jgi:hypothetical protein
MATANPAPPPQPQAIPPPIPWVTAPCQIDIITYAGLAKENVEGIHAANYVENVDNNSADILHEARNNHIGHSVIVQSLSDPNDTMKFSAGLMETINSGWPRQQFPSTHVTGRQVICPTKAADATKNPRIFVVTGLDPIVVASLDSLGVIGSPAASFIVRKNLVLPTHVGSFKNLGYLANQADAAKQAIVKALRSNNNLRDMLYHAYSDLHGRAPPAQHYTEWTGAAKMKHIEAASQEDPRRNEPVWNLYLPTPEGIKVDSLINYYDYINTVQAPVYATPAGGGHIRYRFRCAYCLNSNHPVSKCTIRTLPGWHDPAAVLNTAPPAIINNNPRGRGCGGHERGRGGRGACGRGY